MKKFKAVLFDLDGTLLDTIIDLADSTNFALSEMGFKLHSIAEYKKIVGDGIVTQIKRSLPPNRRSPDTIEVMGQLQGCRSRYIGTPDKSGRKRGQDGRDTAIPHP